MEVVEATTSDAPRLSAARSRPRAVSAFFEVRLRNTRVPGRSLPSAPDSVPGFGRGSDGEVEFAREGFNLVPNGTGGGFQQGRDAAPGGLAVAAQHHLFHGA